MKKLIWITLGLTLGASSCSENRETGRRQINLVSDDEMNDVGEQAFQDILSQSQRSKNSALTEQVNRIGSELASASGQDYNWEIALIDNDEKNAFCLPGGKIGVYTGIVPIAKTNAGLAAVMGHEVAHAVLRHSAERMSQEMLLQTGLALTSVSFGESPYRNIIAGALGIGSMFGVSLPFSRLHENEADRVGLEYMARAGFDPREAIRLWERMASLDAERPPELLSTHPDPENRAKELSKHLDKALEIYKSSQIKTTVNLIQP